MQPVTKLEKEWLIKNGFLKVKAGEYPGLTITSKYKKRKKYYVLDSLAEKAKLMYVQDNEMVDTKKLK